MGNNICGICEREIKNPKWWFKTEYSGYYPIGPECKKKFKGKILTTKQLRKKGI